MSDTLKCPRNILFSIAFSFVSFACAGNPNCSNLLHRISNTGVVWDVGRVGLNPLVAGEAEQKILMRGGLRNKGCIDDLVDALKDEDRFIAAHVLLTFLHPTPYRIRTSPDWNGYDPLEGADQRLALHTYWSLEIQRFPVNAEEGYKKEERRLTYLVNRHKEILSHEEYQTDTP